MASIKRFLNRLGSLRFSTRTFPLALAVVFLVIFGAFLSSYSFSWDDWVQLLSRHLYGYGAYMRYFDERPLSGWTHIVFGPLMGDSRLRWQLFTLTLRALTVLACWALFQALWPRQKRAALLAALLFALYPGFTQQPIAVAYHQHWLQYLLFMLSLWLMVIAVRAPLKRRIPLTLAALLCQAGQLSITEFFVGVELLRPVLLYVALSGDGAAARRGFWPRARAAFLAWLPYLALLGFYVAWRLFWMPLSADDQNTARIFDLLKTSPRSALTHVAYYALVDLANVLVAAWGQVFDLRLESSRQPLILFSWAISAVAAAALGFYLVRLKPAAGEDETSPASTNLEWAAVGLIGALLGPAPLWLADQNILWAIDKDVYHADRFTLAAMPWAALLFVGLLGWALERWRPKALLLSAVLGLLVGFQLREANEYRWLSIDQQRFYWQLYWRAPYIQPGTALITEEIFFPYQGLFSTSGAVNLLYPQQENPEKVAYWMYALLPRQVNRDPIAAPLSFHTTHRLFAFDGSSGQALLTLYGVKQANCLWVPRPQDADFPDFSATVKRWLPVSDVSLILPALAGENYPSTELFGPEPEHSWCYFYQKAELARQQEDWAEVERLGDEARAQGFTPDRNGSNAALEWMPFVEAYTRAGRYADAADLLQASFAYTPQYADFLCGRWQRYSAAGPASLARVDASAALNAALKCSP